MQWNRNQNSYTFFRKIAFENVVSKWRPFGLSLRVLPIISKNSAARYIEAGINILHIERHYVALYFTCLNEHECHLLTAIGDGSSARCNFNATGTFIRGSNGLISMQYKEAFK